MGNHFVLSWSQELDEENPQKQNWYLLYTCDLKNHAPSNVWHIVQMIKVHIVWFMTDYADLFKDTHLNQGWFPLAVALP